MSRVVRWVYADPGSFRIRALDQEESTSYVVESHPCSWGSAVWRERGRAETLLLAEEVMSDVIRADDLALTPGQDVVGCV
jgi:hypothetical protein